MPGSRSLLDQPCWLIVINMVTLDLLRSSLAHGPGTQLFTSYYCTTITLFSVMTLRPPGDSRTRPRLPLPPAASKESRRDSLYYCGLQARIPAFVLAKGKQQKGKAYGRQKKIYDNDLTELDPP